MLVSGSWRTGCALSALVGHHVAFPPRVLAGCIAHSPHVVGLYHHMFSVVWSLEALHTIQLHQGRLLQHGDAFRLFCVTGCLELVDVRCTRLSVSDVSKYP